MKDHHRLVLLSFRWWMPCVQSMRWTSIVTRRKGQKLGNFPTLVVAWRIIPVSKWLVTPIYKPFSPFGRGITRSLGDLRSPWLLATYKSWEPILQVVVPRRIPMDFPRKIPPMRCDAFGPSFWSETTWTFPWGRFLRKKKGQWLMSIDRPWPVDLGDLWKTLPETNSILSPWKWAFWPQKGTKLVFQPSMFRCENVKFWGR